MQKRKLGTYKITFANSIVKELIVGIELNENTTFKESEESVRGLFAFLSCEVLEVKLLKSEIITHINPVID